MQRFIVSALLLLAGCTGVLRAQTSLGQINGTVTDPTGAVIPAAAVTITEVNTQSVRTFTTDGAGTSRATRSTDACSAAAPRTGPRPDSSGRTMTCCTSPRRKLWSTSSTSLRRCGPNRRTLLPLASFLPC